ncbi:MAG TPA: ammonia channel protein, partial [Pseudonocardia sp.]
GTKSVNAAALGEDGLFYGGGFTQLGRQIVAAGAVMLYSFVMAFIIGTIIKKTIGFRVDEESETVGIDEAEHAETGYDFSTLGGRAAGGLGQHTISGGGDDKVSTNSAATVTKEG